MSSSGRTLVAPSATPRTPTRRAHDQPVRPMTRAWRPGRDKKAVRHPGQPGDQRLSADQPGRSTLVLGGGIAGIAAAVGLAERGVQVTLVEREARLGGRVRSWSVDQEGVDGPAVTMSRGFHAFFRQYYNLRALLRRVDPALERLTAVADYPLVSGDGAPGLVRERAPDAAAEHGGLRRAEPELLARPT